MNDDQVSGKFIHIKQAQPEADIGIGQYSSTCMNIIYNFFV